MVSLLSHSYRVGNFTDSINKTPKSKRITVKTSNLRQSDLNNRKTLLSIRANSNTKSSIKFEKNFQLDFSGCRNNSENKSSRKSRSGKRLKLSSPNINPKKVPKKRYSNTSNKSLNFTNSPKSNLLDIEKIEFPMKPAKALSLLKHELNSLEQSEILNYSEIYYVGKASNKLTPCLESNNHGYDDSNCDYLLVKNDHIAYRYEILDLLGKGSFGQVCECFDHKNKEKVALKVIKNKQKFHLQAAVEVKVLNTLRQNDPKSSKNIIKMKNFFLFRSHICITFELISINLYEFLRLNNFQGVSLTLIRCFLKQILTALEFTCSLNIVHCDLKPENILLVNSSKAAIRLIDFGSSCFLSERLHSYIQSRFYRAPEIMLGVGYNAAIDMWSVGCIAVELCTGEPVWPGDCEKDQILHIVSYLGLPPDGLLARSSRKQMFFDNNKLKETKMSDGKVISPKMYSLADLIHDRQMLDFINKCFEWDPDKRINPVEALKHPFIKDNI